MSRGGPVPLRRELLVREVQQLKRGDSTANQVLIESTEL